jgi:hypothetical protein
VQPLVPVTCSLLITPPRPLPLSYGQVDSHTTAGSGKATLAPLLAALRTAASIFFLLNAIDLPEYFQDNMADWMGFFHAFLTYRNPTLAVAEDDLEEGPVEGLQAAILVSHVVGVLTCFLVVLYCPRRRPMGLSRSALRSMPRSTTRSSAPSSRPLLRTCGYVVGGASGGVEGACSNSG